MRRVALWIMMLGLVLASWSDAEAKPGKGRGNANFGGRGRASTVLGAPPPGRPTFSSTFPRGNAWGLRRRLGLSNSRAGGGRTSDLIDGQTITRSGRTWEWDSGAQAWLLQ